MQTCRFGLLCDPNYANYPGRLDSYEDQFSFKSFYQTSTSDHRATNLKGFYHQG